MKESVIRLFENTFREKPSLLIRSPGRVNLIGEHTDYNDGFVFPLAISYAVWLALLPSTDGTVALHAGSYNETASFHLDNIRHTGPDWLEYVKGVAVSMQGQEYNLTGWKGCILTDLPIGSGLSSSAALEMAVAMAFAEVSRLSFDPAKMALLGQQAENSWVGVNCGIMDQLASACGVADHALFIDCRSLELEPVPLPQDTLIAILDTGIPRSLASSDYNTRRAQCETAARFFKVAALRDVTLEKLQDNIKLLDETVGKRALHIVSENDRVLSTVDQLKKGNMEAVGQLFYQSHESLRDLYNVSSPELDRIVEAAMSSDGCYGARMTGAGFGGCAVALVKKEAAEKFSEQLLQGYQSKTGMQAKILLTSAVDGTKTFPVG